ncbi:MAG TPA: hypothetical protein VI759_06530 [Dehalococcoidia bacterium]|nr:hypothetical protein [Dehalococcoidia bacterium]
MTTEAPPAAPVEKLLGKRIVAGLIDGVLMVLLFIVMAAILATQTRRLTTAAGASRSTSTARRPSFIYCSLSATTPHSRR